MVLSILEAVQDLHREDLEGEERPDGPQGLQRPEGFPQEAKRHITATKDVDYSGCNKTIVVISLSVFKPAKAFQN